MKSIKPLTEDSIKSISPDPERDVFVWDAGLKNFGVRVKPSGVKTFLIQYRNARGRTRRMKIGRAGLMKLENARKEARIKLAEVDLGSDPSVERRAAREAKTVAELCVEYLRDAKAGRVMHRGKAKKPTTLATDEGRIERHIKPLLGNKMVDELTRHDVEGFMHAVMDGKTAKNIKTGKRGLARVRGGPGAASKAVSLLSAMSNYAIRKGWLEHNPCQGVEKPADRKRDRFLSGKEYRQLGEALNQVRLIGGNVAAANAIQALALTGCRKGEILGLRNRNLDPAARGLRLDDTKTGAQLRPCGDDALQFLQTLAVGDKNDWLFPANRGDDALVNLRKPFASLCEAAGLEGVTPHVLRHSYATVAHELGYSELTIAGLLGHQAGSVTARYVHHVDTALADAADRVSETINNRMFGK